MYFKKKISLVTLIFLVLFINVFAMNEQNLNKSDQSAIKTSPNIQTLKAKPITVPKQVIILDDFIKVNSQDTIKVETIQFPLMTEAQQQFVIKTISDYRSTKIKLFIDAFYNRDLVKDQFYQDFPYIQDWYFEIVFQSQTELSLKLLNYEFTGGAHGNTSVKNFNFDLVNFKTYALTDKVKNLNLDTLANYCTDYCQKNQIPIFDEKVQANPNLLKIWNFAKDGILLTFPQYSIAPYSSGIIEIYIPNDKLNELKNTK